MKKKQFTPIKTVSRFTTHVRLKLKDMTDEQREQAIIWFIPSGVDINKVDFEFEASTGKLERAIIK